MSPENSPENQSRPEARHRAEPRPHLFPKLMDVIQTRLGMKDEVLDAPERPELSVPISETLDKSREQQEAIEAQLAQFREEKKGSAEADVVTTLPGAENSTYYAVIQTEGEHGVGSIDGGWKLSAATSPEQVTLYKPVIEEDGSLHVSTRNMSYREFIRTQDIADSTVLETDEAARVKQERILKIQQIMEGMKHTDMPDWNKRDDL